MAYAYQAVDDLLNQQNKQNIFGQSSPSQGSDPNNQMQSQDAVKTTTEGEMGASGNSGNSTPMAGQSAVQETQTNNTKANQAAVKANAGKTQQPKVFDDLQSQISSNNQKLQDDANSYVTKQQANQNYGIDQSGLESAIKGDTTQNNNVRSLLNRQTINSVDAFDPGDVSVQDTRYLNNDSGLKNLVSRGQGPQYTSGMGAFDLQTLHKSPGFDNLVNLIRGQEGNLEKNSADLVTSKPKEITDYGTANLANSQTSARDYLNQQSDAVNQAENARLQAQNAQLAQYRQQGVDPTVQNQALQQARDAVTGNLTQLNNRAVPLLNSVNVDPRQYLNVRGDYNLNDVVTNDEADRFNSIMSLLGKSDVKAGAQNVAPAYSYDQTALQNALQSGALNARNSLDQQSQSQVNALIQAAQQRADADDQRRAQLNLAPVYDTSRKAALGTMDPALQALYNAQYSPNIAKNSPDIAKYLTKDTRDLGASDVYTQDEADRLNNLYQDLGMQTRAQAGTGINQSGYNYDKDSYQNALLTYLKATDAAITPAQRAAAAAMKPEAIAAQQAAAIKGQQQPGSLIVPSTDTNLPMMPDTIKKNPVINFAPANNTVNRGNPDQFILGNR